MTPTMIKQRLESPDYDFLRTTPGLGGNIILLTTGGSHAYGTSTPNSDLDIRGITLNTRREILTMKCRDNPFENKATDTVIYPLKQIIKLMSDANPNVIEMFGTSPEHQFILRPEAKLLKDNLHLFLSRKAIASFGGYATGQLWRLKCALARDSYTQPEIEEHVEQVLNRMIEGFNEKYTEIEKGLIRLNVLDSVREELEVELFVSLKLENYPLRDLVGILNEMEHVVRDYDKISKETLNKRNKKKDATHLNKHAMHLIRLLIMGTEVLEGKGIITCRPERDFLMSIRNGNILGMKKNGELDYGPIFDLVDQYEARFKYAAEHTNLPEKPDYDGIDALLTEINESVVRKQL